MNEEHNKAMLRRLYDEVLNKGNLAVADELIAADAIEHEVPPGTPNRGPDTVKQWITMMRVAFPDYHVAVQDMLAEGDRVVARIKMSGTQQGEYCGIAPSGKRFEIETIDIVRVADGMFAEHWGVSDNLGMLQQLGAIPMPDVAQV